MNCATKYTSNTIFLPHDLLKICEWYNRWYKEWYNGGTIEKSLTDRQNQHLIYGAENSAIFVF